MKLVRDIKEKIERFMWQGKAIILYGARQVGKTTLSKELALEHGGKYINCELPQNREVLISGNLENVKALFGESRLVILDEAQTISDIGLLIKLIVDTYEGVQIIATGSSSFELANKVNEPLTGRSIRFMLYPFSIEEIKTKYSAVDVKHKLENILVYGLYPEVFDRAEDIAKVNLASIADNYLYKDILSFEEIKKPRLLNDLLICLALQLGSEVSLNELANTLKTSVHTIERYLNLLEQAFIIFRLRAFSRNLRKEVAKSFKVYFYDLGIRNYIINNYNALKLRNDCGQLWENFCILEKIKQHHNKMSYPNIYFWRTYDQKEIDYIEEYDGILHAYEFKWGSKKTIKPPSDFTENYKNSTFEVITAENFFN